MSEPGDYGIDWGKIVGAAADIKYGQRDLAGLKLASDQCRDFSVAVQAGANIGIFPLYLSQRFSFTHCFEPDALTFEVFCENVPHYLYGDKIAKHAVALAGARGCGYLHARRRDFSHGHSGVHHVRLDKLFGGVPVVIETIDSLNLQTCGLIYLDVEGLELSALHGACATIERCRPVIGVEINKNLDFLGMRPSEVVNWILARRYALSATQGSDQIFTPLEWGK